MENEETETYSAADFGKDFAVAAVVAAAEVVAAYALLAGIGITIVKVQEFRARRNARKILIEE